MPPARPSTSTMATAMAMILPVFLPLLPLSNTSGPCSGQLALPKSGGSSLLHGAAPYSCCPPCGGMPCCGIDCHGGGVCGPEVKPPVLGTTWVRSALSPVLRTTCVRSALSPAGGSVIGRITCVLSDGVAGGGWLGFCWLAGGCQRNGWPNGLLVCCGGWGSA